MHTVCNTGLGREPRIDAPGPATATIADLAEMPPGLWAVDAQSQSGHPGSPHYSDQLEVWLKGEYHRLPLDRADATRSTVTRLTLAPRPAGETRS